MDIKEFRGLMEAYQQVNAPREELDEAEGSYGETPKAYAAASKTKMTAKRKPFLKAMQRRTNPANRKDAYDSPRKGMTASDREEARAGAAYGSPRGHDYPSQGPGGVTKSAKKLRKQKAMGEFAKEEFELWVNSLVEEGYDLSEYTWDEMRDIYEEEQLNELSNRKLRAYVKKSEKSHKEINKKWDQGTATEKEKLKSIGHEIGQERAFKRLNKEELDIFDVVLEFLQVEGYAETLDEAEWIMANELDYEDIEAILEAEGSYGETPKAYSAASKTKMTAKRKPFLKAMLRRTNPANRKDAYGSPRKGLTADDRERARAGSAHGVGTRDDHDYPSEGPGGVTKNPKKLRKQKAMGEFAKEDFELWVNSLVEEGYDLSEYTWDEMYEFYVDESAALGTALALGGMAAGRAIHGKLQDRKAKKELEGKRRTSDYLTMKSRTKNAVFRDRRDSGDSR